MPAVFRLDPKDARYPDVRRRFLDGLAAELQAGARVVTITEPKRSDEANARMWCLLTDLANQVGWRRARWRGDRMVEAGAYVLLADEPKALRITKEQWKDIMTAAMSRPQLFAGIDGGLVAVGLSTSRMSGRQIKELCALIEAFGAEKGVEFSEPPPVSDEEALR